MAGVLAALIAGSAFAAAAPNITEPSGGLWVGRIAPKHRLTITQSNTVNGDRVSVFAGQGVDVAASLQPSWTVNVNLRGHFAKASAAGFALRPTTTDRPVFTASEIEAAQGVHATVYLQQEGIFIDMIEGGKRMGDALPLTPKLPMPAASYRLGNMKTELPTTSNINTDLQANDWNEDGFSDYMLTYLYLDGSLKVAVAYIDGKSLYEAFTKNDASLIKTSLVDYSTMVTGNGFYDYDRGVIPAASARSAVGDLDGAADGRSEFVLHHTTELTSYSERQIYYGVVGLGTGPGNVLLAWKITPVADAEPGVRFDKIPVDMNSLGEGGNYYNTAELGSDSVGVAVGDVDGDGRAEICALHYRSNRFFLLDMKGDVNVVTNSFLYLFKWQNGGMKCSNPTALPTLDDLDQYRQAFGDVPIGDNMDAAVLYGGSGVFGGQDRYRHSSLRVYSTLTFPGMPQVNYDYDRSGSPIDAVTADLDGDGRDELAWTHTRVINNADYMNPDNSKFMGTKVFLTVHKWPAGDTPRDLGSYTDHELWYPERTGGDRHSGPRHFRNFSMTAGAFNYPSGEGAGPDQRQIAFMNGNWSVWSWNNRNLTKLGERTGASP
ncbi:MAG: hypothetical protein LBT65_08720, partial [Synergistaceae bacterium]|nr:hypothetical protein [Synergistaceae bacterium]